MSELIFAEDINKRFGSRDAVKNLNLKVSAGEIFGLVGPDGAGKTTTLRLLCGALRLDSGSISISGYDISRQTEQARAQIGYLPQRFSLYEELTVLENLRFFAEVRGLSENEWKPRCLEILKFVGLDDFIDRWAGNLSGGMKQKLGLAAALVHQPQVLLLDEPTTGVDPVTRQDFWQLIIRLTAEGEVGIMITTPYMDEAARCTQVGILKKGILIRSGTPNELREGLNGRVMELKGSPLPVLRRIAAADPDVLDAQLFGNRIHLRIISGSGEMIIDRLERKIQENQAELIDLRMIKPKLDDVFMEISTEDSDGK
jgi:ABC-2 type transport system ATP-binding protein